jgi:hypothetical protein
MTSPQDSSGRLSAADLLTGARFLKKLPRFFKKPWQLEEASAVLAGRFAGREANFLQAVKLLIFHNGASPYKKLLDLAGCEFGDIARLVEEEGLESTLKRLCRSGVYLTIEEFKGLRPAGSPSLTPAGKAFTPATAGAAGLSYGAGGWPERPCRKRSTFPWKTRGLSPGGWPRQQKRERRLTC